MYILNFAISKSFFNDAHNVEIRGNDLFHQQKDASRVYMNRLTAYQANSYDSREFAITVRYRFKQLRANIKVQEQEKVQNHVSNYLCDSSEYIFIDCVNVINVRKI